MKEMWLMGSLWPVLIILFCYLYFIFEAGPKFMKFRNPMNIDRFVMMYDVVQVLFSLYIVKEVIILLLLNATYYYYTKYYNEYMYFVLYNLL